MKEQDRLITYLNPKSPVSEAYRVLRTNIQFTHVDNPVKTIVITSAGPKEGKTVTSANLAVAFAQAEYKVLLVDADLRRPNIHKIFDLQNHKGLTTLLMKHSNYHEYLNKMSVGNLDVILSGPIPPNPSEMLNSDSFKKLLERFKEDYDIILIDSPPVVSVTDAVILSKLVDGTILVVASGKLETGAAIRSKELLENVKANILGVVLNQVKYNKKHDYYYSYYLNDREIQSL